MHVFSTPAAATCSPFELPTKAPMGRDPNTGVGSTSPQGERPDETLFAYRKHFEAHGVDVLA